MPIIVCQFFPNKSSILSIILCNLQFYDECVRRKFSVLLDNISSSFCKYILIVFVSLQFYVSFFSKNSILLYLKFSSILSHMLEENLQFYRKISALLFSITSYLYLYAYHCICENNHKNLQFLNFS